jgi:putative redox protein
MTINLYAERKGLPLRSVGVRLRHDRNHAEDCAECEDGVRRLELIEAEVSLDGDLNDAQRARLLEIADKCPVHRSLEGPLTLRTVAAPREEG